MKKLPQIRSENIVTQEIGDELMIYDLLVNKAFCLNKTSTKIYNACGNHQNFRDLKSKYNFSDDLIFLALDEFEKNDLLAAGFESPLKSVNRREIIRKIGLSSMIALPVISAIIAPVSANAASADNCPPGYECVTLGTTICLNRPSGVYSFITFETVNGICRGTLGPTTQILCPSGAFASQNLCVSTTGQPLP